jgi:class 3 adenylate cyclase
MFCDLVDSTGIVARRDAEEWRDVVAAYLDVASAAVTEMGGKVAKKLGDGLMALLGYPVARKRRLSLQPLADDAGALLTIAGHVCGKQ